MTIDRREVPAAGSGLAARALAACAGASEPAAGTGRKLDDASFDRIRDNPDVDIVYVILPGSRYAEYAARRIPFEAIYRSAATGRTVRL